MVQYLQVSSSFVASLVLLSVLGLCSSASANDVTLSSDHPVKYVANRNTIICRRTTDFQKAEEAVNQVDMHWFEVNGSCRFIKKGSAGFLVKTEFPYSNF